MENVRDSYVYTEKFKIHILDLTRIDLATPEDINHEIDKWAMLFKATTWEEIKMLAEKNKYLDNAVVTIAKLSEDDKIRQEIEAREEFLRIKRTEELFRAELEEELKNIKTALIEKEAALSKKVAEISEKNAEISEKEAEIERLRELLSGKITPEQLG